MKKVYKFKQWDIKADVYIVSKNYATRAAIKNISKDKGKGAIILEDTVQEVDESSVDSNGFKIIKK